jgi:hypothetical protein
MGDGLKWRQGQEKALGVQIQFHLPLRVVIRGSVQIQFHLPLDD